MKPALLSLLLLAAALLAAPKTVRVHGWNTWKRPESGGEVERIKPDAAHPHGVLRFLPDAEKPYSMQTYGNLAIKPDQVIRCTFRFTSSADAAPGATITLSMRAKDAKRGWLTLFRDTATSTVNVVAGTDQSIFLEVDIKRADIPEAAANAAFLCPFFSV